MSDTGRGAAGQPGGAAPADARYAGYANPPPLGAPQSPPPPGNGVATPPPGTSPPRSPDPPPPPADERAESGAEGPPERRSTASDFINRLFGRGGVRSDQADDEEAPRGEPASRPDDERREPPPQPPEPKEAAPPQGGPRLSERAGALARQFAQLTGEELDALAQEDGPFKRALQSEIDRRTARANRQRDEQGRVVRQQRVEELKQQARQARSTDVYRSAELEEQVDQLQQQEAFVRGLVEHYDRVSLDPIMAALPEADRAPILADLPDGLEGRAHLVRAALRRLEQIWRADEARKARGAPARKRENAARRDAAGEDDGEPELVSGIGRGRNGKPSMNDWLRQQLLR